MRFQCGIMDLQQPHKALLLDYAVTPARAIHKNVHHISYSNDPSHIFIYLFIYILYRSSQLLFRHKVTGITSNDVQGLQSRKSWR